MKHRFFLVSMCLISALLVLPLKAQEIAITLDDLPYVMPSRTSPEEGVEIVRSVNAALQKHHVVATGFVFGKQLNRKTRPALHAFADAGHTIGNHSWSHADYGILSVNQFRRETRRTHRAIAEWVKGPRFYRFPYLREGETQEAKEMATAVLGDLGYQNVPVTIDNDEWQFNAEYVDALERNDQAAARNIAQQYLAHMKEKTMHFQLLARKTFGRDVKHILLLHMNRINSDHLGTLLDWYASTGWKFITVEEAMTDPLYAAPDIYVGSQGLSQIERVIGRKIE